MIPRTRDDLDGLIAEVARQGGEIAEIFDAHPPASLLWRPDPSRWSATGHVAHLCLVNDPYLESIEGRIRAARSAGGPSGDGPYHHPWIGSWFARSMEPPPKRRLRTMKAMVPDPSLGTEDVRARFADAQRRLAEALEAARGLDLGKIRFGSPFFALMRLSLGTAFHLLLAHNRRHIWLIRETLERHAAQEVEPGERSG